MAVVSLEYVTYIAAPPEKVWQALTKPEYTRQYFFGRSVESDWRRGSPFILRMEDGRVDTRGKVLKCQPPRELEVSWNVEWIEEFRGLPEAIVNYRIEPFGDVVRLTMTQSNPDGINPQLLEGGRRGWPVILSGLKTLLETGRAMPAVNLPPEEQVPTRAAAEKKEKGRSAQGS